MKKTILFGLFISLTISCLSCSNNQHSMTDVVSPSISPVSPSDNAADTQVQQPTQGAISPVPTDVPAEDQTQPVASPTDMPAADQTRTLAAPIIITPNSTTDRIVYVVNSEGILCIYDGEKYGYINENGIEIAPFIYDKANPFSEGMACVYYGGKFGFINSQGETALPFIYDKAGSFHEGLAYFEIGDQYGFIDENGNKVFLLDCDSVSSFQEGLAYFSTGGKYGYIDKTGKVVIDPIYADADYFNDGAAKVRMNDKVGVINKSGLEIVPINFDDVYTEDGLFITRRGDKSGCINAKGQIILPAEYTDVAAAQGVIQFSVDDKWNTIDEKGNVINTEYTDTRKVPNSDLSIAKFNEKYGIIDSAGKTVVPFTYDEINYSDFRGMYYADNNVNTDTSINRFSVRIGDKYGVVDNNGNIILPCQYDDIQIFDNGMIGVEQDLEYSLADQDGKIITKNKYNYIAKLGDFFNFRVNDKNGFLNDKGEEVIPAVYDYITDYYNDVIHSDTCFVATNYSADDSDSIVVTRLGSNDDISGIILENEITPRIKLYHDYLENCEIESSFSEEETTNLSQMNEVTKTFRLYQLDGSANPVLYVYVEPIRPQNFPASYSGFFLMENDKVNTLISGSECGGSMGGNLVCLYKDNKTSKIVIAAYNHMGGFGGYAYGVDFYNIVNGKADTITSFEQISQDASNYDKSDLLKNAELFYGEDDLPYTEKTITDAEYVTEYDVNDKQTTIAEYDQAERRFRAIPME